MKALYLREYPDRIPADLAARIITDYAACNPLLRDATIKSVTSGYGHSTNRHYDDSTQIVTLAWFAADTLRWHEAIYGVNGNRVALWMD